MVVDGELECESVCGFRDDLCSVMLISGGR